jgi:hypothetical protein
MHGTFLKGCFCHTFLYMHDYKSIIEALDPSVSMATWQLLAIFFIGIKNHRAYLKKTDPHDL